MTNYVSTKVDNKIVTDPQVVGPEVLAVLDRHPLISIDTETTGLDWLRDELHGISLAVEDKEWYVTGGALQAVIPDLRTLCKRQDKNFLLWNAGFDFHFLYKYGIMPTNFADVQVAAYLIDENDSLKLKEQAEIRLGLGELPEFKDLMREVWSGNRSKYKKIKDVSIYDLPLEKLGTYAADDARYTFDLWKLLEYELIEDDMLSRFYDLEMPYLKVIWKMERNGFYIDQKKLAAFEEKYSEILERLEQRWDECTGGVNPRSPDQVAVYFYDELGHKCTKRTPTKKRSVDELSLMRIAKRDDTGMAELLLKLRSVEKTLKTYVYKYQKLLYDGRIHTNWNRTGTVTGRIASSKPPLQNIPIRTALGKEIRDTFAAPDGRVILVLDLGQIELRVAAHFSRDGQLLKLFREGGDPHQLVANIIHCPRPTAKTMNYAKFYGCGVVTTQNKIEEDTGVRPTRRETRTWMNSWDELFEGITRWSGTVVTFAHKNGYVMTIGGRKRHLHNINSYNDRLRSSQERMAVNSPIQGSVGDFMQDCMLESDPILDWFDAKLLAQVHDELVIEVPEDGAQELAPIIQWVMEGIEQRFNLRVPVTAEPGIGKSWTQAKENSH
jgi:DNA polymerase-1